MATVNTEVTTSWASVSTDQVNIVQFLGLVTDEIIYYVGDTLPTDDTNYSLLRKSQEPQTIYVGDDESLFMRHRGSSGTHTLSIQKLSQTIAVHDAGVI